MRVNIRSLFLRSCLIGIGLWLASPREARAATNCGTPGANQAIIWQDNFSGNCDVLEIGNYTFSQLLGMSVGNDAVSSVSLGVNVYVRLYQDNLFDATSLLVTSSRSVVSDFNDKTSSLQVGLGRWKKIGSNFPGVNGPITLQLLMDGSILANDSTPSSDGKRNPGAHHWFRYTPSSGSDGYAGGTWVEVGQSHFGRSGYVSGMLKDGRFFIGGGEYVWDQNGIPFLEKADPNNPANVDPTQSYLNHCEIFDPRTNLWTDAANFPQTHFLADGVAAPLADGRLLVASAYRNNNGSGVLNADSFVFDPYSNPSSPWSTMKSLGGNPPTFAEGSLTLLQNDNVFLAENGAAEFLTGTKSWVGITQYPVNNPYISPAGVGEGAGILTLYDGRVLVVGGGGNNAIYTPNRDGTVNPAPNAFANTAPIPGLSEGSEYGQALMPTGNALVASHDSAGTHFSEFWPSIGKSFDVTAGAPHLGGVTQTPLPDGSLMVASQSTNEVFLYQPGAPQLTAYGRPVIDSISAPSGGVYTMVGRTLNGLTNGANEDDEAQNYTSFPVISVKYTVSSTTIVTRYCSIESVSTMSIAPGRTNTVKFRLPAGIPSGRPLTVTVTASGLAGKNSLGLVAP